jgi:GNAT superfamily N-acetyltransferase
MIAPRRARSDDAAAIDALHRAAYARNRAILGVEPMPLRTDALELLATMEVWLLETAGGIAGSLVLRAEPEALLIWSVATAPDVQGHGLGGSMLDFAEARARDLGLQRMKLYTGQKLAANVAWYERRGYATDRIETLSDRVVVHMSKSLAKG